MPVARLYSRQKVQPYYNPKRFQTTFKEIFNKDIPPEQEWGVSDQHAYWASQASYGVDKYEQKLLDAGYKLDSELSNDRYKIYYNKQGAIVANRGTRDLQDLKADAGLAFYNFDTTGFIEARDVAKKAQDKYTNVHHVGHSLGGSKALRNAQEIGGRATVFNPGTGALGTNAGAQKVYTAEGDIVADRIYGTNITKVPGVEHSLDQYEPLFQ